MPAKSIKIARQCQSVEHSVFALRCLRSVFARKQQSRGSQGAGVRLVA